MKKWVRDTLVVLGAFIFLSVILVFMRSWPVTYDGFPNKVPKMDSLNLKSAILMFQADNQRFPNLTRSGTAPAAGDDLILSPDQYRELVLVLRGKSPYDNKRHREYLPLNGRFETIDQYKCKLAKGYKKAKTEAQYYVILDVNEDGIDLGGGRKILDPILVFWVDPAVLPISPGTKASAVDWNTVKKEGICVFDLP